MKVWVVHVDDYFLGVYSSLEKAKDAFVKIANIDRIKYHFDRDNEAMLLVDEENGCGWTHYPIECVTVDEV